MKGKNVGKEKEWWLTPCVLKICQYVSYMYMSVYMCVLCIASGIGGGVSLNKNWHQNVHYNAFFYQE